MLLAVALFCAACQRPVPSSKVSIAAAADLQFAMEEISREFRRANAGVQVEIAYGSSGNFYNQIRNGAPFDVFLSADIRYPQSLAEAPVFTYAAGRIVVWVPAQSALDPATALENAAVKHIAIANPAHAPYGRAAEAALHSLGIYDNVAAKLVYGENIAQALQFVESGAADVGIVALSLAVAPAIRDKGRYWELPANSYPEMRQGGVILKRSKAAAAFRDFLTGTEGRRVLREYGFSIPKGAPWTGKPSG